MALIFLCYDTKLKFSFVGMIFFKKFHIRAITSFLSFPKRIQVGYLLYSRLYWCPWVVFSQSVALKIKNPQKQKSKRFNFALAFRFICTHPSPIIELIFARFREIKRFYSPLKSDIKSALLIFIIVVVFKKQFYIFMTYLIN